MKIDFDKKHPFTSVNIIPERQEEKYLTEEQTKEFRKIGLRVVQISYASVFFSIFALFCEITDSIDLFHSSSIEKTFAIIGYFGLAGLLISIVFLFIEGRKLTIISKQFEDDNKNKEVKNK